MCAPDGRLARVPRNRAAVTVRPYEEGCPGGGEEDLGVGPAGFGDRPEEPDHVERRLDPGPLRVARGAALVAACRRGVLNSLLQPRSSLSRYWAVTQRCSGIRPSAQGLSAGMPMPTRARTDR